MAKAKLDAIASLPIKSTEHYITLLHYITPLHCNAIKHNTIHEYNAIKHNTIQYKKLCCCDNR